MNKSFIILIFIIWSFSATVSAAPTHLDKTKVRKGCSECHKGHGKRASRTLIETGDEVCMKCHGSFIKGQAENPKYDIFSALNKESSHMFIQELDSSNRNFGTLGGPAKRISCKDCHNAHRSEKGKSLVGVRGYQRGRPFDGPEVREFEICYKCHSGGQIISVGSFDVSLDFSSANPSYHPVETFARNAAVPSLKSGYTVSSIITCSDCHGNDDPSGPVGPHGSVYKPILRFQYLRDQTSESPNAYELCYRCHERSSILNDDSFKAHRIHVVYNQISCSACHSAHGSRINRSLIKFESTNVLPNSTRILGIVPLMQGKPRCYLSCHVNGLVYEHKIDSRLRYTVNDRILPQW